jgi:hypothetical protein
MQVNSMAIYWILIKLSWINDVLHLHLSQYSRIPGYSHSWFVPENRELGFKGLKLFTPSVIILGF